MICVFVYISRVQATQSSFWFPIDNCCMLYVVVVLIRFKLNDLKYLPRVLRSIFRHENKRREILSKFLAKLLNYRTHFI